MRLPVPPAGRSPPAPLPLLQQADMVHLAPTTAPETIRYLSTLAELLIPPRPARCRPIARPPTLPVTCVPAFVTQAAHEGRPTAAALPPAPSAAAHPQSEAWAACRVDLALAHGRAIDLAPRCCRSRCSRLQRAIRW